MKKKIPLQNVMYPTPVTILGLKVDDRVNFINIAHVGILTTVPPHLISFGINKKHFSMEGILKNKVFTVNLPSTDMVIEADYVGMESGARTDKSEVFEVFYGEYDQAPIIKDAPLSMVCKLYDVYEAPGYSVVIGEIVETYVDDRVLQSNGRIDLKKADPLLFDMTGLKYWKLGEEAGICWREGKQYRKK